MIVSNQISGFYTCGWWCATSGKFIDVSECLRPFRTWLKHFQPTAHQFCRQEKGHAALATSHSFQRWVKKDSRLRILLVSTLEILLWLCFLLCPKCQNLVNNRQRPNLRVNIAPTYTFGWHWLIIYIYIYVHTLDTLYSTWVMWVLYHIISYTFIYVYAIYI